jgi:hypothetical protein
MSFRPADLATALANQPSVDSGSSDKLDEKAALISPAELIGTKTSNSAHSPPRKGSEGDDTSGQLLASRKAEFGLPSSSAWEEDLTATPRTPPYSGPVSEAQLLDQASAAFAPLPPGTILSPLPKPVLIPRVNPGSDLPFARAWPPELVNHGITQADFVAFIDSLNIMCAPHAAIRILQLAALGMGLVPNDYV